MEKAHDHAAYVSDSVFGASSKTGLAAQLYCERRRRSEWFDKGLFWEPAWDLLLYLYDAHEAGQEKVALNSVAQSAIAVSPESAQRWVQLLVNFGYVVATERPDAVGPASLNLTRKGREAMAGYLRSSPVAPMPL